MSNKRDGGPAFPQPCTENGYAANSPFEVAGGGMTLRDYFAAKFCAAMVSTIRDDRDYDRLRVIAEAHDLNCVSQFFAREAYKQADAMLAAREGKA